MLCLQEDEFFDALETGMDQLDSEVEREQELRRRENEVGTGKGEEKGEMSKRATENGKWEIWVVV